MLYRFSLLLVMLVSMLIIFGCKTNQPIENQPAEEPNYLSSHTANSETIVPDESKVKENTETPQSTTPASPITVVIVQPNQSNPGLPKPEETVPITPPVVPIEVSTPVLPEPVVSEPIVAIPTTTPPVTEEGVKVEVETPKQPVKEIVKEAIKPVAEVKPPKKYYHVRMVSLPHSPLHFTYAQDLQKYLQKKELKDIEIRKVERKDGEEFWVVDVGKFESSKSEEAQEFLKTMKNLNYQKKQFNDAFFVHY